MPGREPPGREQGLRERPRLCSLSLLERAGTPGEAFLDFQFRIRGLSLGCPRHGLRPVVRGGKGGPGLLTDLRDLTHSHLTHQGQGDYLLRLSLHRCAWPCEQVGGEGVVK